MGLVECQNCLDVGSQRFHTYMFLICFGACEVNCM